MPQPPRTLAENVFWVPKEARRSHLQANAKQPSIGKLIDEAMAAIEVANPGLKGVLLDEAAADRIGNDHKDDGDRSRLLQHRRSGGCVWADEAGERRGLPAPHDMGEKSVG